MRYFLTLVLLSFTSSVRASAVSDTKVDSEEREVISLLEKLRMQSSDCNAVRSEMLSKFDVQSAGDENGFKSGADAKKAIELLNSAKPIDSTLVDQILARLMDSHAHIRFEKIEPRFFAALCNPFRRQTLVRRLIGGTPDAKDFPPAAAIRSTLLNYAADLGSHPDSVAFVLSTDLLWKALKTNWFKSTPELTGRVSDLRSQLIQFRTGAVASHNQFFASLPKGTKEYSPEQVQQLAQLVRVEFDFIRKIKPGYLKILEQLRQLNP
ncbi:MAG: hypothetical protein JST16_11135 [Bdellovibrionales bacterium]|nr:hypothetical protein [Bdellovibrionales bacterium]